MGPFCLKKCAFVPFCVIEPFETDIGLDFKWSNSIKNFGTAHFRRILEKPRSFGELKTCGATPYPRKIHRVQRMNTDLEQSAGACNVPFHAQDWHLFLNTCILSYWGTQLKCLCKERKKFRHARSSKQLMNQKTRAENENRIPVMLRMQFQREVSVRTELLFTDFSPPLPFCFQLCLFCTTGGPNKSAPNFFDAKRAIYKKLNSSPNRKFQVWELHWRCCQLETVEKVWQIEFYFLPVANLLKVLRCERWCWSICFNIDRGRGSNPAWQFPQTVFANSPGILYHFSCHLVSLSLRECTIHSKDSFKDFSDWVCLLRGFQFVLLNSSPQQRASYCTSCPEIRGGVGTADRRTRHSRIKTLCSARAT